MAVGVITLSTARKFDVDSDSCFHAIQSLVTIRPLNLTGAVCSGDPVNGGKTVTLTYSTTPTSVVNTVSATTATPMAAISDSGLLTVVLVLCALFFSGVFGYRMGFTA